MKVLEERKIARYKVWNARFLSLSHTITERILFRENLVCTFREDIVWTLDSHMYSLSTKMKTRLKFQHLKILNLFNKFGRCTLLRVWFIFGAFWCLCTQRGCCVSPVIFSYIIVYDKNWKKKRTWEKAVLIRGNWGFVSPFKVRVNSKTELAI